MSLSTESIGDIFSMLPLSPVTLSTSGIVIHVTNRVTVHYSLGSYRSTYIKVDDRIIHLMGPDYNAFQKWLIHNQRALTAKAIGEVENEVFDTLDSIRHPASAKLINIGGYV